MLGKQIIHVKKAAEDGNGQQDFAQPDRLEQHGLHDLNRWKKPHDATDMAALELTVLNPEQNCLAGGQRQHSVGNNGKQDMYPQAVGQRVGSVAGTDPQHGGTGARGKRVD